jgi:hypothetical protein
MLVLLLLLAVFAGTLAAGACRGGPSKAAMDAARIEQVRENLYMITGSGLENPGMFSGGNWACSSRRTAWSSSTPRCPGTGR